jgi:hypothetical protein
MRSAFLCGEKKGEKKMCGWVRDYKPAGLVTGRLHAFNLSRCQRVLAWDPIDISSMDARIGTQHNVVLLTAVAPSGQLRPSKPAVGGHHPLTRRRPFTGTSLSI